MKKNPKVSIITPCFNREQYIAETLECIRNINYENWECIVVDDASTDSSAAIVKTFVEKDSRFVYVLQEKSPIPLTKNNAVAHSSGKYIFPLDSDDLIHRDYIKEAVELLEENEDLKIVYAQGVYFGSRKGIWKLPDYSFEELLLSNCIHNSAMFRKMDFERVGGYNPLMLTSEEWDLWLKILANGGEVYKIEKKYFYYRKHSDSTIDKNRDRGLETFKLIYANHKDLYSELLDNPILLLNEHRKYKKKYNQLRVLSFRKPLK